MDIEKLIPVCKDYIWGGTRLVEKYGKSAGCGKCAESWELSFHPDGETRICDGRTLREAVSASDLGENCSGFDSFPMMIKLIDAESDLSVQVHPSDAYAKLNENSNGKTEMWYVAEASPGACLYVGFKENTDRAVFEKAVCDGTVLSLMNRFEVKRGDVYFIPAGTLHAIGKGCLICEIQQNSNITYRVYDYNRNGADGKPRALHIQKALDVVDLCKYTPRRFSGNGACGKTAGASRFFTVCTLDVSGSASLPLDPSSFRCVTCVSGEGSIENKKIAAGDSYFVPANRAAELSGKMTLIISSVRRYAAGIDLGGTFIKGGICDDLGQIIADGKTATHAEEGADAVASRIAGLCGELTERAGLTQSDILGIGAGVPGMIDRGRGSVIYSNNLRWKDFPIAEKVGALTGKAVSVTNDANAAALGETLFGAGQGLDDTVMLTLGTGVGGGIVIDGRLYEGNRSAGAELGHSVIVKDGELCTCGRRGCLEAYASATALIRDTKRAMAAHPDSKMNESKEPVDGRTAFAYADKDVYAAKVVDDYLGYIACGIADIANIFRPQAVIIGGGIGAEGRKMTDILEERASKDVFAGDLGPRVPVVPAALGNKAGILGAAALILSQK